MRVLGRLEQYGVMTFFRFNTVNISLIKIKCKNKRNFNCHFLIFVLEIEIVFEELLHQITYRINFTQKEITQRII